MRQREHLLYERYIAAQEAAELKVAAEKQKTEEKKQERVDFYEALNKYREQRELKQSELRRFSEAVYDNYMQTALNAIYITALENVSPMSEESYTLAEKNVANYIKEHDGARNIIRVNKGRTSLLDTIFEAVSTAANNDITDYIKLQEAEKEEEKKEKEEEEAEDEKKSDDTDKKGSDKSEESESKSDEKDPAEGDENASGEDIEVGDADGDGVDDAKQLDKDADGKADDEEDPVTDKEDTKETLDDDKPKEDKKEEDSESEDKEDEEEKPQKNFTDELDDDDEEEESEEDDSEEGEDPEIDDGFSDAGDSESEDDSEEDEDDSEDEAEEEAPEEPEGAEEEPSDPDTFDDNGNLKDNKEEMFKKLENDAEVTDAVDIIAKRISDAETEFIQKNAEDKKKIEQIVNKVDDRIKAVAGADKSPEEKEQETEEAQQEATRLITDIKEQRFHSVFEELVKDNFDYIMKDVTLKEAYTDIDGTINVAHIVESTRVMYGFLEFVNTIQLEKVNSDYILKVIKNQI